MIQSVGHIPVAGANEKKGERGASKTDKQSEKVENKRRKSVFYVYGRVNWQTTTRGKWPATAKNYDPRGHVQTSLVLGLVDDKGNDFYSSLMQVLSAIVSRL
jgi:hypothetical protein